MGKMTLEIKEIMNMDLGLGIIMNQKLPIVPAWKFGQWKENTEKFAKRLEKETNRIVKELGIEREDGQYEITTNKQLYYEQLETYSEIKEDIEIPEIPVHLLKDVPTTVRFTTLVGHYLQDDVKCKKEKYPGLSNQQVMDLDMGLSCVLDELMPMKLAMKLGDAKRISEKASIGLEKLKKELKKELGALNHDYEYEIVEDANKKEFDEKIVAWLNTTAEAPVEIPALYLNDFETHITINGKKKLLELPLRFFTLMSKFIKEKKTEETKEETDE